MGACGKMYDALCIAQREFPVRVSINIADNDVSGKPVNCGFAHGADDVSPLQCMAKRCTDQSGCTGD
jgi:hypothetical protein